MRSIKIAGISGIGKTTLIRAFSAKHPETQALSYGEFVAAHDVGAVQAWRDRCEKLDGLVLMDEHLEFGDGDFDDSYRRENTVGIVLLAAPLEVLLERRRRDAARNRADDAAAAVRDHVLSEDRAFRLARRLSIPLLSLEHLNLDVSLDSLERFVAGAG